MDSECDALLRAVIPDHELNSWEREELLEQLGRYDRKLRDMIIAQIEVLWPVSHALCFSFLEQLDEALGCLAGEQLPDWVKVILAVYEADGLRAAHHFMSDVENRYLCRLQGENGLTFAEARGRLQPYVHGLAGGNLRIEAAACVATDSETVFLPHEITLFQEAGDNFRVYKLIASLQWAMLHGDLYCQRRATALAMVEQGLLADLPDARADVLSLFLATMRHPRLASRLYHLLQFARAGMMLKQQLPGLMRDSQSFFAGQARAAGAGGATAPSLLEHISSWLFTFFAGEDTALPPGPAGAALRRLCSGEPDPAAVFSMTVELDATLAAHEEEALLPPPILLGELLPGEAHQARLARREEQKQRFIEALAAIMPPRGGEDGGGQEGETGAAAANVLESGATIAPVHPAEGSKEQDAESGGAPRFICLDDEQLAIPEEVKELGRQIEDDLGGVPAFYIASASMRSGSRAGGVRADAADVGGAPAQGTLLYDEWDYRRQGFRKNWCHLLEKRLHPVGGTFVGNTLSTYRGQIVQLKRQFEMMRTQHRFLKRQRDGDEIDVDALIEAHADLRAGHMPSERLFIRLLRDERDIAALFLVDMSSSTEGWVGTALKESLVLLSEAMESLGDRYAIHGFSGMRRTRCEIYHVKGFAEPWSEEIKGRIAAIGPIDYTRMGPPIRHCTAELAAVDAKVRLLVLLTDGKPEDYDDYKGAYAIEDTRHALIEAKAAGIHPFCITIDRQAQEYMAHMFGRVNYVFINDVRKLPLRVPEIYRTITS